jgi:hypothetical protein
MSRQSKESERVWREHLPLRKWMGWHEPRADDLIPTPPSNLDEAIPYEKE